VAEESSVRKRLSIPKVDASVLQWWDAQHDPALSVRLLVRAEIERNGYADVAFQPVTQQPRRGRPPAHAEHDEAEAASEAAVSTPAAPARATAPARAVGPAPTPVPELVSAGPSAIDALMNG